MKPIDPKSSRRPGSLPVWVVVPILAISLAGAAGLIWWFTAADTGGARDMIVIERPPALPDLLAEPRPFPPGNVPRPTLVTLQLDSVTPQQALEALMEQTGISFSVSDAVWRQVESHRIHLEAVDEPFWKVVDDLLRLAELSATGFNHRGEPILEKAVLPSRLRQIAGPFVIDARQVTRKATANPAEVLPIEHQLALHMVMMAEPNPSVHVIRARVELERALDEYGRSLLPPQQDVPDSLFSRSSGRKEFMVDLQYDEAVADRIAVVAGHIIVLVAENEHLFEVSNVALANPFQTEAGELTVQFVELTETPQGFNARVRVISETGDPHLQMRFNEPKAALRLLDGQGRAYQAAGPSSVGRHPTRRDGSRSIYVELNVMFQARSHSADSAQEPGPPAKLLFIIPTDLKEVRIPFEFTDLPVP
jgi:hypothetical protein